MRNSICGALRRAYKIQVGLSINDRAYIKYVQYDVHRQKDEWTGFHNGQRLCVYDSVYYTPRVQYGCINNTVKSFVRAMVMP